MKVFSTQGGALRAARNRPILCIESDVGDFFLTGLPLDALISMREGDEPGAALPMCDIQFAAAMMKQNPKPDDDDADEDTGGL